MGIKRCRISRRFQKYKSTPEICYIWSLYQKCCNFRENVGFRVKFHENIGFQKFSRKYLFSPKFSRKYRFARKFSFSRKYHRFSRNFTKIGTFLRQQKKAFSFQPLSQSHLTWHSGTKVIASVSVHEFKHTRSVLTVVHSS
jgi:hypothetical protein